LLLIKDRLVTDEPSLRTSSKTLDYLRAHAEVRTVGELASFPARWPGLYGMLKECGIADDLDALVASAAMLLGAPAVSSQVLASSRFGRSLMSSWLAPRGAPPGSQLKTAPGRMQGGANTRTSERVRALLSLLKTAPANGVLPGPDAPLSVLACVDGKDIKALQARGVRSLQELAFFVEFRESQVSVARSEVPLLDEMILQAKALLA